MQSALEQEFAMQLKAYKLKMEPEYRFCKRKWRFDFADVPRKIAVEVEGGTYQKSRHTTGTGFAADCEKYNMAAKLGWFVYRFDSKMVKSGKAIDFIREVYDVPLDSSIVVSADNSDKRDKVYTIRSARIRNG